MGYLEGEAARGLELLAGRAPAEILTVQLEDSPVSARVISAGTESELLFEEEAPAKLNLVCRVELELTEYSSPLDQEQRKQLSAGLEQELRKRLEQALTQLRQWQADCVGLGLRSAVGHPGKWKELEEEWPAWFTTLPWEIALQVKIHN